MQARCSGCEDTSWNLASVGEAPDLQETHVRPGEGGDSASRVGYLRTRACTGSARRSSLNLVRGVPRLLQGVSAMEKLPRV